MRYFLELSYNGKEYNGWQIQPNAPSVQQALQKGLSTVLRMPTEVVGAGRTDTGVHASYYVAHFDTDKAISNQDDFCYHLNAVLPHDIAIRGLRQVRDDAHARFDAVSREYKYYVSRVKNPFVRDTTYIYTVLLDVELMNEAASSLIEHEDFTSFSKLHSNNKTNICHIHEAYWKSDGEMLVFTISADRFLRNMVRAIVGTLLNVGRGKISIEQFKNVIECKNRSMAGTSAPPQGLFLTNVKYKDEIYL